MSGLNDELWMKERYEQVCRKNPAEYALISLKIKRFRIFNRLFGREAGDWLVGQVYEAIRTWIGEDEYVAHIVDKKCPAGVCKALLSYVIDREKCKGCTLCARVCPADAISGTVKQPHVIDPAKCLKCGACIEKCKFGAIYKK